MYTPLFCLLGFVLWTAVIAFVGIVVPRVASVLAGTAPPEGWPADVPHGSERYRRTMRAHLNCVENLPLFASVLFACSPSLGADDDDAADPVDESFGSGKADGGCLSADAAVQDGVLALVNDPAIDAEILDASPSEGGAGLYHNAAVNIVDARPIATPYKPPTRRPSCQVSNECAHPKRCSRT